MKKEHGITLIALVVTIVIMLLLAGITLNLALGENGLIKNTREIVGEYEDAGSKEEGTLQKLQDRLNDSQNEGKDDETPGKMIGKGTIEEPFLIQSIEDLVAFSNEVNKGTTYAGQEIKLMVDLNFQSESSYVNPHTTDFEDVNKNSTKEELITELTTGEGFTPIGTGNLSFQGNFNGNNKVISNLYKENGTPNAGLGLFGNIENSKIHDLTVTGNIHSTSSAACGGVVVNSFGNSILDNVKNYINIKCEVGDKSIGGIIGGNFETLTITNCLNGGNIENAYTTGGVIGVNDGTLLIDNCYNEGSVTNTTGPYIAGILGRDNVETNTTTIKNSYNTGDVTSNADTEITIFMGGIVGAITGTLNIDGCYNKGNVQNLRTSYSDSGLTFLIGGLIGNLKSNDKQDFITNSYNLGSVSNGTKIGGIVGDSNNNNLIVDRCYNSGKVSSAEQFSFTTTATNVGGIIGAAYENCYLMNSYNSGEIVNNAPMKAASSSAGIVAMTSKDSYIINTYNIGDVTSTWSASGLIYTPGKCNIYNSYNLGNISASYKFGVGHALAGGVINPRSDIYYWNNVTSGTPAVGTGMSEEQMKAASFVTTLNNNIKNINLSQISSMLNGYSLVQWKQGSGGHPVLE